MEYKERRDKNAKQYSMDSATMHTKPTTITANTTVTATKRRRIIVRSFVDESENNTELHLTVPDRGDCSVVDIGDDSNESSCCLDAGFISIGSAIKQYGRVECTTNAVRRGQRGCVTWTMAFGGMSRGVRHRSFPKTCCKLSITSVPKETLKNTKKEWRRIRSFIQC